MRTLVSLCFFLVSGVAFGQVTPLLDWKVYRGNVYERTIVLPVSDTSAAYTARLNTSKNGPIAPAVQQPTVQHFRRSVTLRWEKTNDLPESGWLEILANNETKFAGLLSVTKNPSGLARPGSLTIVNQINTDEKYLNLWDQLMLFLF